MDVDDATREVVAIAAQREGLTVARLAEDVSSTTGRIRPAGRVAERLRQSLERYFAPKLPGRLADGESVLVHGAAGGVGTAALQVAKGLGARTVGVVSSDEKERVAREAGADEVVRSAGPW